MNVKTGKNNLFISSFIELKLNRRKQKVFASQILIAEKGRYGEAELSAIPKSKIDSFYFRDN